MRDMIFKTFSEIETPVDGVVGLGGFAVDEYLASIGESGWKNFDSKKLFGVIIDPDDSYTSIDSVIDVALHAAANILMFDINYATGRQISHIRNMMKKRNCKELTDLYETRIAFSHD